MTVSDMLQEAGLTLADGRKGVGEFRNDKPWNITNYDSFGHVTGSWVEGEKQ